MDEMDYINKRLDGIVGSLQEISKVLIQLAKVEERLSTNTDAHKSIWSRLHMYDARLKALEIQNAKTLWIERVMWVAVTAAVSIAVNFIIAGVH